MIAAHVRAQNANGTSLKRRASGFARTLFPARTVRTIGLRISMNVIGKSNNRPNKTIRLGTLCRVTILFVNCRIANGSTSNALMKAARPRFVRVLFIVWLMMF